ncbi:MAG: hypothetical protein GX494_12090 [Clostridiaceae bacterium]|nr:hypothetical protein [Clostridiaceae bacterium]
MGHERVSSLPQKSQKWVDLVDSIGVMHSVGIPIGVIAAQTLRNVQRRYERLSRDAAVKSAFAFLVAFSRESGLGERALGSETSISLPHGPTPLAVVKELRRFAPAETWASEYGQIAFAAAADALGQWYRDHATGQMSLFRPTHDPSECWSGLATGSGFCELSRLFFARLTERYLNYFLDRIASAVAPSIQMRDQLHTAMTQHIDGVSKHAFETAKITQSFAAGWYSSRARERNPDESDIERFLSVAFGKLREELRLEEERI